MSMPTDNTAFAESIRNGEATAEELIAHLYAMSAEDIAIGDVNAMAAGVAYELLRDLRDAGAFNPQLKLDCS